MCFFFLSGLRNASENIVSQRVLHGRKARVVAGPPTELGVARSMRQFLGRDIIGRRDKASYPSDQFRGDYGARVRVNEHAALTSTNPQHPANVLPECEIVAFQTAATNYMFEQPGHPVFLEDAERPEDTHVGQQVYLSR